MDAEIKWTPIPSDDRDAEFKRPDALADDVFGRLFIGLGVPAVLLDGWEISRATAEAACPPKGSGR
jgi:hypothetical protein